MNTLPHRVDRNKTPDLHKLPALGAPLCFEAEGGLDRGHIDHFCRTRQLGLFTPVDPAFLRLLMVNGVRWLWVYERPRRWQMRRYLVDTWRLLQWLDASAKLGAPWEAVDENGETWFLIPAHLVERRRFTRHGGKVRQ